VDTGAGSFLGGAGGVCNVSGRFVYSREDGGRLDVDVGMTEGFGCSWVESDNKRMQ
jgi:hypothetical protein